MNQDISPNDSAINSRLEEDRVMVAWLGTWTRQRSLHLLQAVDDFINRHACGEGQRRLLHTSARDLRSRRNGLDALEPGLHWPLLVVRALLGDDEPALPLTISTALLELGIDELDHLADREIGPHWAGVSPELIQLSAAGLIGSLPQLALVEVKAPSALVCELVGELSTRLIRIGNGQQADLEMSGGVPTPLMVEQQVRGKTGERRALYSVLAARFAGGTEAQIVAYERAACAFGIARQLGSDCLDLFADPEAGRDLKNGTRTWPIATWLEGEDTRSERVAALERACVSVAARIEVCRRMVADGVIERTAARIEFWRAQAHAELVKAKPSAEGGFGLRRMIDACRLDQRLLIDRVGTAESTNAVG